MVTIKCQPGQLCPSACELPQGSNALQASRHLRRRTASRSSARRRRAARLASSISAAVSVSQPLPPLPLDAGRAAAARETALQRARPWQALASRLSQRLQRTEPEDHLSLCQAFGAASLEDLRVRERLLAVQSQTSAWSAVHAPHGASEQHP